MLLTLSHAGSCGEDIAPARYLCGLSDFIRMHWRLFLEGMWRFDGRIEEKQGMFTKIQLVDEDGLLRRTRSAFVTEVSHNGSKRYGGC